MPHLSQVSLEANNLPPFFNNSILLAVVNIKKTSSTSNVEGSKTATNVTINEQQVDLLLEMLKTADITSTNEEENKTLKDLESNLSSNALFNKAVYTCIFTVVKPLMCCIGECTVMKGLVEKGIKNSQK